MQSGCKKLSLGYPANYKKAISYRSCARKLKETKLSYNCGRQLNFSSRDFDNLLSA